MGTFGASKPMGVCARRFLWVVGCLLVLATIQLGAVNASATSVSLSKVAPAQSATSELTCQMALSIAEKAIDHHIAYLELDPEARRRILNNFVLALDWQKILLLQSDIDQFMSLPDATLEKAVENLAANDSTHFLALETKAKTSLAATLQEIAQLKNKHQAVVTAAEDKAFAALAKFWGSDRSPQTPADRQEKIIYLTAILYRNRLADGDAAPVAYAFAIRGIRRILQDYERTFAASHPERILNSMLHALDPYTHYFNEKDAQQFNQTLSGGSEASLGISIYERTNGFEVEPFEASPAEISGVKNGDLLTHVNGRNLIGSSANQVAQTLKGRLGEVAHLTLLRDGKRLEIAVPRAPLEASDSLLRAEVRTGPNHQKLGVIDLRQFYTGVAQDFREALDTLIKKDQITGLVIDLRDNPGGNREQSLEILNLFIKSGVGFMQVRRNPGSGLLPVVGSFEEGKHLYSGPIVVLVNERSASASEIVAKALQDYQRAIIVGPPRTFGKGVEQALIDANEGVDKSLMKVSHAVIYSPNGESINAVGVAPDVVTRKMFADAVVNTTNDPFTRLSTMRLPSHVSLLPEQVERFQQLKSTLAAKSRARLKQVPLASEDDELTEGLAILADLIGAEGVH